MRNAIFSECGKYRYVLSRIWDTTKPIYLFIGLNPSTADEKNNDTTVSRCTNLVKLWDGGGLHIANLFSYVTTYPYDMKQAKDPIGPDNDLYLKNLSKSVFKIVVCWGNDGNYKNRSKEVLNLLKDKQLFCLQINETGEPHHPLRISNKVLIDYPHA